MKQTETQYVVGIDGGGVTTRVAVVGADMQVLGQSRAGTANPSIIGRGAAAGLIQNILRRALADAKLNPSQVGAAAVGIAGASGEYAGDWLKEVIGAVLPQAHLIPSSDNEIALIGAHGERRGVLVLSGTGSVAYGVNAAGESAQVGGWGHLLGDEGSGYWIGLQGLRAVTQAADKRAPQTSLTDAVLSLLDVARPKELIVWLHNNDISPTQEIAKLATLVIEQAAAGDDVALGIVDQAATELHRLVVAIISQLYMNNPPIAFAGGLLSQTNALSQKLADRLGLESFPQAQHKPVIGAALLARQHLNNLSSV